MSRLKRLMLLLPFFAVFGARFAAMAAADEKGASLAPKDASPAAEGEDADAAWEFSSENALASAYVWRGLNLLGEGDQQYSPGVLMPGFSATRGIWTLGWAAALQLGGENLGRNVDAAAGMEQDVYVQVEKEGPRGLAFSGGLTLYAFPASRKPAAGADRAAWVEPAAGVSWDWKVQWTFKVFWFHGIQEGVQAGDYVYGYAAAFREWTPVSGWTLRLSIEGGRKWYTRDASLSDNAWDVQAGASAKRAFSESLFLGLQASAAWSNFSGKSLSQELAYWGVFTLGLAW